MWKQIIFCWKYQMELLHQRKFIYLPIQILQVVRKIYLVLIYVVFDIEYVSSPFLLQKIYSDTSRIVFNSCLQRVFPLLDLKYSYRKHRKIAPTPQFASHKIEAIFYKEVVFLVTKLL